MDTSYKTIIKKEYIKCLKDPIYFLKKYCKIQHPLRGKIPFELYPFQEDVLRDFQKYDHNIILKSRQLGISTLTAGFSLWMLLFGDDKNIIVICTKIGTAKNLITKVKVMYDSLPSWLKVPTTENNKLSLQFKNGSQIKAVAATSDSGRSEALSLLIIDECAFIRNAGTIWVSSQQTIATGGKAILLSTPNGTGNFFHKTWTDSESGLNDFHTIKLDWRVHPERDEKWRVKQDIDLGPAMAKQECDCDFISSGRTVIAGSIIKWYQDTTVKSPIEKRYHEELWIWVRADYNTRYIVCADVGRGNGDDPSAFHILNEDTLEQVAEYVGKIGTKDFGNLLVNIATEYNNALICCENASIGWAVLQQIIDERKYSNIYYSLKGNKEMDIRNTSVADPDDMTQSTPGFTISSKTRPLIIENFVTLAIEKSLIIRSQRTINEMFVFIWIGNKPQAQIGYHDDLIMSLCEGLWVRDYSLKKNIDDIKKQKVMIDNIHVSNNSSSDIIYTQQCTNDWQMELGKNNEVINLKDWI
jgi:hypothetical protein